MNQNILILAGLAAAVLAGCAVYTPPTPQETDAVIKSSFSERSIAKLDRLDQSEPQAICSATRDNPSKEQSALIEKLATATIQYPADGKLLGDWQSGERIAQSGVGMQWSDNEKTVNGGNCYACHQIDKKEIAYGNIGPSLHHYGKLRGNSEAIQKYTWGKIWNSHAFTPCSQMPRYGDAKILTEAQIKDVMALLLDPASPVNQ
ncbi:MAG: sulfur oxidation c-type cytochrome SoxX [Burkholderiaceae bacterium]